LAITALDGVISGFKPPESLLKVGGSMEATGVLHSLFYTSGRPGAAAVPSPGIAGASLTSYPGQIPFSNPASGLKYLARLSAKATQNCSLILADRLWHNSGIAVATVTAQTVNSTTWPARDRDGTTNGADILVGIEVSSATTNAGAIANTTMSYTNSAGVAGQTATMASFPATATPGTFIPFQLANGDNGVRSVQSITLGTSYAAGAIHLVAYRIISEVGLLAAVNEEVDVVRLGMPQLYNGTVPFLMLLPSGTTATTVSGQIIYAEG
jgi:hypothetical protein